MLGAGEYTIKVACRASVEGAEINIKVRDNLDEVRKRALVVAPFFNSDMNANRPLAVAQVLSEFATVDVLTTDFDHWTKRKKVETQLPHIERIIYLKTAPYRKNTGIGRFASHVLFSVNAIRFFLAYRERYQILYVTLPMNILGWFVLTLGSGKWKIVDITDIWPDVLPFPRRFVRQFRPAFSLWREFFNRAVAKADVMMTVSDSFFDESLKYVNRHCQSKRFYLAEVNLRTDVPKEDILTVAYSGNLGHLYDFETILDVLSDGKRQAVQLFIIGDGDRREWLLRELKRRNISHRYFGSVYDPEKLSNILSRAHLGFNGFINTSAAFSTKASTYFAAGLPILNSMGGDLRQLVLERELGFNYIGGDPVTLSECFSQINEPVMKYMSQNCTMFFAAELERAKVRQDMLAFLQNCMGS